MDNILSLKNDDRFELELLFDIVRTFGKYAELRNALAPVLNLIEVRAGLKRGTVALLDKDSGLLKIEEANGFTQTEKERGFYRLGEGLTGRVFETGEALFSADISKEPRFLNRTKNRSYEEMTGVSYYCVPICSEDGVIGTLSAERQFKKDSVHNDRRLLEKIAAIIADTVKLHAQIIKRGSALRRNTAAGFNSGNALRAGPEIGRIAQGSAIVGASSSLRDVYEMLVQVAPSDATVLISGESGTGKELVAAEICRLSKRSKESFLKLNCAALPESIIESELFGHEKGAFTGAVNQRKGRFELADKGTIFLDEIAELSPQVQVKLLRVLQERELERLGGSQTIKVDVRLITASNKNLEKEMREGRFREDLFYRLNVFPLHVPPLRERKSDVILLADYFTEKYADKNNKEIKRISQAAIDLLTAYSWPGNVRELENCIERAVILSKDSVIHAYNLPLSLQSAVSTHTEPTTTLDAALSRLEKEMIIDALKITNGNMAAAARNLGITERQMGLRIHHYGIHWRKFRKSS
ncbi:MAG: sigma 54-interacting transcriptional regulator [Spirochaetaceae bacterium]|jgi:Nif-specific regulatory protein|nr:sigma 54-interacting transcriptional regulator [Spirochaetaceae bacterium]